MTMAKLLGGLAALGCIAALTQSAPALAADTALQMVSIDVEGGGGTLFVTPEGKSLLIDTGWPVGNPYTPPGQNSPQRIADVVHAFGLKKIDYLITTHYHLDHVGGLGEFLKLVPVGTVIDHGDNRELPNPNAPQRPVDPNRPRYVPATEWYDNYLKAVAGHKRIVAQPGQSIMIGSMKVTVVASDAKMVSPPLPGAGEANPPCDTMPGMQADGGQENTRSVSTIITYGKVKIATFGDLTWDREKDLFCPVDRVGPVDVVLVSHHGTTWSSSPAMYNALRPKVVIMGNAVNKGDDPERVKTIVGSPRIQDLWRLHNGKDKLKEDGDPNLIANPGYDRDAGYNIRLRILKDGDITVINERNGFNKTYKAGG